MRDSSHCQHGVAAPTPLPIVLEKGLSDDKVEVKKDKLGDAGEFKIALKSSLRQHLRSGPEEIKKGSVRWRDSEGEELSAIMEFESNESGELEKNLESVPTCMCVIL